VETDLTLWGHRAVVLQNELLRVTVLAGHGADIVEFLYKPLDLDFMWANPSNPRRREQSTPPSDNQKCFGEFYYGGWQELFPHGSLTTEVYGAKMVQHGEVWGLPWDVRVDEDSPRGVSVTFTTRTRLTPFLLERTMRLSANSSVLEIEETAYNVGREDLGIMWGHHPAFGAPFLSGDCVLYAPAKTVNVELKHRTTWPVGEVQGVREDFSRMLAPDRRLGRMLYLEDLTDGWYALMNPKLKCGFGMRWDVKRFPKVWLWQEAHFERGSPWFGNAYTTAIEPFTHLPFARERNEKMLQVKAGGKVSARFLAFAVAGRSAVHSVDQQGRVR